MTETTAKRVAAIDCGTNTIRLLIADVRRAGDDIALAERVRRMLVVRLGEDLDKTGVISSAALRRTAAALADYRAEIEYWNVDAVRMGATSASRDASNSGDFVAMVQEILGFAPDIVTGDEEARLSFAGAVRGLPRLPRMVIDIGGGSTEFVVGTDDVDSALSVDIGSVRLTERHFGHDPPLPEQVAAARADVHAALADVRRWVDVEQAQSLVAVAGTATTIVAMALGLASYDPDQIHQATVPADQVHRICQDLLRAERPDRAAIPVMHPGRVDVIAAGALILDEIITEFGFDAVTGSETDILDGLALSIATP